MSPAVRNVFWILLPVFLLSYDAAAAQEPDSVLAERIESAVERREKHRAMSALSERLAAEPMSVAATDRIVRAIMADELYVESYAARMLPALAGERGLSDQALIVIATALSGDAVIPYPSQPLVADLFASAVPVPDEAFAALEAALQDTTPANSRAVLGALAATTRDDSRFDRALEAIRIALVTCEYGHVRSDAAGLFAGIGEPGPLPSTVIDALVHVATNDEILTTRIDAFETLVAQPLGTELATILSTSLAAEIITPTPELRERSRGHIYYRYFDGKATETLGRLHAAPYPEHVVYAWIALTREMEIEAPLGYLAGVIGRGELNPEQHASLDRVAAQHRFPAQRRQIYATLYAGQSLDTLPATFAVFSTPGNDAERIRAGYQLLTRFPDDGVPREIADAAAGVLTADASSETLVVAATLLANTRDDLPARAEQLVAALDRHPEEYGLYDPLVELATRERIDGAVVRYAADKSLATEYRRHVLRHFAAAADPQATLSSTAETALRDTASNADDYFVIQYAGDALEAWGASVPLRAVVTNRQNQSQALFVVYIALFVFNLVVFILGLGAVVRMPIATTGGRSARLRRAGLVAGWLAAYGGVLFLFAIGFLGFLGHNSLPPPSATLRINIPAYIGAVVYFVLMRVVWRRWRRGGSGLTLSKSVT